MTPRLHVLLGAGGVGKTTLAAGYALALAETQASEVGLLSIDPAQRLKSALGLALGDEEVRVPGIGNLQASALQPGVAMRRWAREGSPAGLTRLGENPFFLALADHLASATDLLAAVRIVEWAERHPGLTDMVVDTAPGLGALDFLRRPERLSRFLSSRLVVWLRHLAEHRRGSAQGVRRRALRVMGGLERIGGEQTLLALADLFLEIESPLGRMVERLVEASAWIHRPRTELLLIAAVRPDAATVAGQLAEALSHLGLKPSAVVINRALPDHVISELLALPRAPTTQPLRLKQYALAYATTQKTIEGELHSVANRVIALPELEALRTDRLQPLSLLGERLKGALEG